VEEIARVYGDALFGVAKETDSLDEIREQLGQFADAVNDDQDLQVFFFSPYMNSAEKRDGIAKAISGGNKELVNFLELLAEKHRMPVIFRIRDHYEELWQHENKRLEVRLTSAVELDESVANKLGEQIEKETGQKIELTTDVDDYILGGLVLRVGNMVLDASLRAKLEKLRKEVAAAA
jgi:F-type H+-transporting ATPase subunit delta